MGDDRRRAGDRPGGTCMSRRESLRSVESGWPAVPPSRWHPRRADVRCAPAAMGHPHYSEDASQVAGSTRSAAPTSAPSRSRFRVGTRVFINFGGPPRAMGHSSDDALSKGGQGTSRVTPNTVHFLKPLPPVAAQNPRQEIGIPVLWGTVESWLQVVENTSNRLEPLSSPLVTARGHVDRMASCSRLAIGAEWRVGNPPQDGILPHNAPHCEGRLKWLFDEQALTEQHWGYALRTAADRLTAVSPPRWHPRLPGVRRAPAAHGHSLHRNATVRERRFEVLP